MAVFVGSQPDARVHPSFVRSGRHADRSAAGHHRRDPLRAPATRRWGSAVRRAQLVHRPAADPQVLERAIQAYRERYRTGRFENAVYADVPALLRTLRERRYRLMLVTSKPATLAREIVAHFDLARYFDAIYGSELDGLRSDKAELLGYLVDRERLDPARCLMIGDRRHDIVAARAHGIRAIAVSYGYGTADELQAVQPDAVISTPLALLGILDS